jgi:pyruvate,water dikinase
MLPALPRLMANSATHYEEVAHPRYAEVVAGWGDGNLAEMKSLELVDGARELTRAMGRYLTALQVDSLGIAAGTEMFFTRVYEKLIRREGDPPAVACLLGADSLPIRTEKALYDLAEWCSEHDALADYLQSTPVAELVGRWSSDPAPAEISAEVWQAWRERFQSYLDGYGHSVYDLDFSNTIPAHDPTPQLQALQAFIGGIGRDPYARQERLLAERQAAIGAVRDRIKGLKRRVFDITMRWAQTFTQLREDSIFEIGLAYPVLRRMLFELSSRLVDAGAIAVPDDVFWLDATEIEANATALDDGGQLANASDDVAKRKARWRAERLATPPAQLPKTERIMGMKTDVFMPVDAAAQEEKHLKGIGCSPGQVTATARVLEDPGDFDDMRPGDILIADITTPAWTPLFALASGIVTNVGGPLSHGSIVAREYGIPAVLGTGIATKRIQSGQRVTVDGDAGIVELH